jgi:hypothetical protein
MMKEARRGNGGESIEVASVVEAQIRVENPAGLGVEVFDGLSRELAAQSSVRHVLDWLLRQDPPLEMEDMITQDEFSRDIRVPYREGLYLVYDSS